MLNYLYFTIPILFFWLLHIFRRTAFWLYFWQLKEYRLDRFFDGLRESRNILFPKISFLALFLFLFSAVFLKVSFLFEGLIFALYGFFGAYSLYLILKSKWRLPKFTKKIVLLLGFSMALEGFLVFYFFPVFFRFLLGFEILFPIFISFCVGLWQIPTVLTKKWIIKKAKEKRKKFKNLIVVGITGSYGKTSAKEFLAQILSLKYRVLKTEGNNNTEIGVAKTVLGKLNSRHQIFVCEMAAYRRGEIKAICDIVCPKIGILTGISEQHISLFGNFKNIINTKYELITSLPEDGIAIFNMANKECQKLAQRTVIKKRLYSTGEGDFDIFAGNIQETKDFVEFDLETAERKEKIKLNIFGRKNIENFLGAAVCALSLGITFPQIKKIAPKIKFSGTAIKKIKGKNGASVIDDSYSQNPDGVLSALNYLKNYSGKKIILMPCLIELGKSSPSWHKIIGRKIGEVCDLAIIITPYYFKELKFGAMEAGMEKNRIVFLQDLKEISKKIKKYFKKENVILIEGRVPEKIKFQIANSK